VGTTRKSVKHAERKKGREGVYGSWRRGEDVEGGRDVEERGGEAGWSAGLSEGRRRGRYRNAPPLDLKLTVCCKVNFLSFFSSRVCHIEHIRSIDSLPLLPPPSQQHSFLVSCLFPLWPSCLYLLDVEQSSTPSLDLVRPWKGWGRLSCGKRSVIVREGREKKKKPKEEKRKRWT
jgi:hypothetical protein